MSTEGGEEKQASAQRILRISDIANEPLELL